MNIEQRELDKLLKAVSLSEATGGDIDELSKLAAITNRVGYFDELPTPLSTEDLCYQGYGAVWKLYSACMNGSTLEWKLVGWSC